MRKFGPFIFAFLLLVPLSTLHATETKLWYNHPAKDWMTEALPIGNGRLGAMLFGGVPQERIQFNEESLWIGDEADTGAYQAFDDMLVELSHGAATDSGSGRAQTSCAVRQTVYPQDQCWLA